mmetsp:Transcript_24801/g.36578  ORF Transcript_24801/g.36578 Transcript_24801/m.36578 type:complete len:317 (+) Transcript_24801:67-1017(+)
MNDRLADLKRGAAPGPLKEDTHSDKDKLVRHDMAANNTRSGDSKFMKTFFDDVELVKQNIVSISETTKEIYQVNQAVSLATTPEREHELTSGLSPVITETNKKAALAKQLLQRLKEECDSIKSSSSTSQKEANELRIRENLINTLTRKFVDVMKSYQNAQQKFKLDIKKKMKRQVQIVKPDATPEEIDQVMMSGGGSGEIFKNVILKGTPSDSVRNASRNVQDKYQDVLALEHSVAQLHEMFVDFAQLTEQQGELLDQIEFQVKSASDFIDEGNMDMVQAVDYAKAIRKRQLCLCVIFLVVVGIIVGIVFAVQGNK